MNDAKAGDWISRLYSDRWTALLTRLAIDKYGHITDPHQLMEDARQQLAISLDRKSREAAPVLLSSSYILVAFKNSMTDLNRQRSGRVGPRAWLKAFGGLGSYLFEQYCLGRRSRGDILKDLRRDTGLYSLGASEEQVAGLLDEMDREGECESQRRHEQSIHDEDGAPMDIPNAITPEFELMREQSLGIQALLFQGISTGDFKAVKAFVERIAGARQRLGKGYAIDDDQYFILQSTLTGVLTEQRIGELLGGLTVRQVRYRREQALKVLESLLREAGIDLDELIVERQAAEGIESFVSS
ncbi:MAG: hypothetical protein KJ558_09435 [Gammaproteobacteria bacterium]|nr:hypothetical protein [Gammaproteobacteria bacterium]MBU1655028.1 hypothetical protein [Gammaproteobacteria bacterium]MBU1961525.1 hypothetical protein [Gammaproteobacteria bacterium]